MVSPRPRILVAESERFSARATHILREVGEVSLADLDRAGLLGNLDETDVLWVRLRTRIDKEVLNRGRGLKFVLSPTTGLNHIDVEEAEARGICVLSLRGEAAFLREVRATAEHTICLLLALLRHLPGAFTHVKEGGWNRDLFLGNEIHGKTVGVVGYGRLGRLVGSYLLALGARVVAADPAVKPSEVPPGIEIMPLEQLLHEADIVTLHVNLDDTTRDFFGRDHFHRMKNDAWFVNTSRGELVDEAALLERLENRHLAGAAVDVLRDECNTVVHSHPLVKYACSHENLLITPHIGGCTFESMEKTEVFLAEKFRKVFEAPPRRQAVGER